MSENNLLEISDLKLHFPTDDGDVRALDSVSFGINKGEIFGLVGESASGKSVTSLTVIGLTTGVIDSGSVTFEGEELLEATEERMRELRGNEISMIFQEPMTALNPLYTVEKQIYEVMKLHGKLPPPKWNPVERMYVGMRTSLARPFSRIISIATGFTATGGLAKSLFKPSGNDALFLLSIFTAYLMLTNWPIFSIVAFSFLMLSWVMSSISTLDSTHHDIITDRLRDVKIPNPSGVARMYPHELSGGMRQRVMIAMMMACEPRLLIADEPTTALDVTIQSQIVELMKDLRNSKGTSILLITHDIGLVAEMCDRVGVMYAGRVVEQASVEEIFANPLHDYTKGLMASSPRLDSERKSELPTIPGQVASPSDYVPGCRFCQRMGVVGETLQNRPPTREISPGHLVEDCPVCVGGPKVGEEDE